MPPKIPNSRAGRWFVISAGIILSVVGAAKLWSATGQARILAERDPLLGIPWRDTMLLVGGLEIVLALYCFLFFKRQSALLLVCWLSLNFALYHFGLWWINWETCDCLGRITGVLRLSTTATNVIVKMLLAYLLVGSWGLWTMALIRQRRAKTSPANEFLRATAR